MIDPTPTPNKQPQLWFILFILCLVGAQLLFQQGSNNGQPPWLALGIVVLGVLALVASQSQNRWLLWLESQLSRFSRPTQPTDSPAVPANRDWGIAVSAFLTLYVLGQIPRLTATDNYTLVTVAWLAAAGFFLYGVAPHDLAWPSWRRMWSEHKTIILGVLGIVLVAFLLRAWQVGTVPKTLNGDEASQGLEAIRVISGDLRNPFSTGWLGVPSMSFFFNSLSIRFMGRTVAALRLPWVLIGTATVLVIFLFVRQLKGNAWGLVAAALVATYHYHIHYSRLGSNQVADPFFLVTSLWLLYRGLDRKSALSFALSGMVCGLAFYFYAGARLTPLVILTTLVYLFLREPRTFWRAHGVNLLVMMGAFLVVFAPMGQYAIQFPQDFNARINMVGIIQSGWLEQEVAAGQRTLLAILWDQFQRAFLAFNFYPDRTVWYGLAQPLLDPFFGTLFLVGLGFATLRLLGKNADVRMAPMVAWWWGGMILGGMLTESPPSSQRLITLSVPTCFFITLSLWELVRLGQPIFTQRWGRLVLLTGVLIFSVTSIYTYFGVFIPQRTYGGPHALLATEIAPRLNELKEDNRFYFVGAPFMYWGFGTIPYLVADAQGVDLHEPVTAKNLTAAVSSSDGAVFIVLPARGSELTTIEETFPGGQLETFISPVHGGTLVSLYVIPERE